MHRANITLEPVEPEPEQKEVEPKPVKPKVVTPKKKYEKKVITLEKFEVQNKTVPVAPAPGNDTEEEVVSDEKKKASVLEPVKKAGVNLPPDVVENLKKLLCDGKSDVPQEFSKSINDSKSLPKTT